MGPNRPADDLRGEVSIVPCQDLRFRARCRRKDVLDTVGNLVVIPLLNVRVDVHRDADIRVTQPSFPFVFQPTLLDIA